MLLAATSACAQSRQMRSFGGRGPDAEASKPATQVSDESAEELRDASSAADMQMMERSSESTAAAEGESVGAGSEESGGEGEGDETSGGTEGGNGSAPSATISGQELIPEGWPDYVPIMSGFAVRFGASDENGLRVVATGVASTQEVREFYQSLPGWKVGSETAAGTVGGESEDDPAYVEFTITMGDESVAVRIIKGEERTTFQLQYTRS